MVEVKIKKDDSGHRYLIPAEFESEFDSWLDQEDSPYFMWEKFASYMVDSYPKLYVDKSYFNELLP